MVKQLFFLLAVVFFQINLCAQIEYKINGKVTDEAGLVIPIADVLIYDEKGESIIQYTTLVEGVFELEINEGGIYILEISSLGYATYNEQLRIQKSLELNIQLKENTEVLAGVEVVAAKNPITYSRGNLKIDVQNPYFSSVPDPVDLLSRIPNVQVAPDRESISIIGKGNPLLYLGNQRITIEEFNALPIDGIETIEIINNPSAKYEAQGRAVIQVALKKSQGKGLRGSAQETASFRRNYNNYVALNTNYTENAWSLRANLGHNQLGQWESNSFEFQIPERDVLVDYTVLVPDNTRVQWNGGVGIYYGWNDTDYISLNSTIRLQTDDSPIVTDTFLRDGTDENFIETDTNNNQNKDYYSASFNFNKKLSKGWNLFTGIQYSGFNQKLASAISNNTNDSGFVLEQLREQEYSVGSLGFRADIEKEISHNVTLESGLNISMTRADAFTDIQDVLGDANTVVDFAYDENLYGVYGSLKSKLSKKIDTELGLRVERNTVNSTLATSDSPVISRKNTSLFPKANITYVLDSTKTLNLNYARSIRRPDFSRTSSISVFINPFLEGTGNVNLRPSFTNEVSINYQKGNKSIYATYYRGVNPLNFTISYDAENDNGVLAQVNLEKEQGFNTGVRLPFSKGIWTSNNTISLNYNQLQDSTAILSSTRPYVYAYTNHQFKIAKDTTLAVGGWAVSKRQEGIFNRNGLAVFEAALSKTFFKKWDCTLRFNDITRAMNFEESYAISGVIADGVYFADGREVAFSLKYRFGNKTKENFKNKDVDSNIDRIR